MATVPRLEPGAIIVEALASPVRRWREFLDLATVPLLISLALQVLLRLLVEDDLHPRDMARRIEPLLIKLADIAVPTTMFLVGWHRLVLLGPGGVGRLPGFGWGALETGFLLHLTAILGPMLAILAFVYASGADSGLLRAGAAFGVVAAVIALRVSFGLSARALGVPWSIAASWRYGAGSGFAIVGATAAVGVVGSIAALLVLVLFGGLLRTISDGGVGFQAAMATVFSLATYAAAAALATAQAVVFRELVRFRPGAPLAPPPA